MKACPACGVAQLDVAEKCTSCGAEQKGGGSPGSSAFPIFGLVVAVMGLPLGALAGFHGVAFMVQAVFIIGATQMVRVGPRTPLNRTLAKITIGLCVLGLVINIIGFFRMGHH